MRAASLIEPLEDRIAPAGVTVAPNGKSATYTDANGDLVQLTTTKGNLNNATFTFDSSTAGQLTELSLNGNAGFNGTSLAFSVTPQGTHGSDQVPVGYVDAIGLSLNSFTLPGDLGRIDAGGGSSSMALGKLSVASLGVQGSATQNGLTVSSNNLVTTSNITGTVGLIQISGNLDGTLNATDFASHPGTGNIQVLNVGGSIDGSKSDGTSTSFQMGEVTFTGTLGKATISGGINGGASEFSGGILGNNNTLASIGSVTVLGSVPNDPDPNPLQGMPGTSMLGGTGAFTGEISSAHVGSVTVAGDVRGGVGGASGLIQGGLNLKTVHIDGSLIGGNLNSNTNDGYLSGNVFGGAIGSVTIGKNIFGGSGVDSGRIVSTGTIANATVMGNIYGGTAGQNSTIGISGAIQGHALGTVLVDGSIIGGNVVSGDTNQQATYSGVILSDTNIGKIVIGDHIQGGSGPNSGTIATAGTGNLGTLIVGQGQNSGADSILGGTGANSGDVFIAGSLGKATLMHNLTGGAGPSSGQFNVTSSIGSISIGGNMTGGSGDNSAVIATNAGINSLSIGGTLMGGAGNSSADIVATDALQKLVIGGDFIGGSSGSTKLTNSGYVQADTIGSLNITGAFQSGSVGTGAVDSCGTIRAVHTIGSITIGSIAGNASNPAIISAVGQANLAANATTDVAIASIKINGTAAFADILAGYNTDTSNTPANSPALGTGVNADAQIGSVYIGGNIEGSNIVAGVGPGPNGFGTAGSTALSGSGVSDLPSIISRISSIVIKGTAVAAPGGNPTYGIAAQYIGSAGVDGTAVALIKGPDNDTFAGGHDHLLPDPAGDTYLYEV